MSDSHSQFFPRSLETRLLIWTRKEFIILTNASVVCSAIKRFIFDWDFSQQYQLFTNGD